MRRSVNSEQWSMDVKPWYSKDDQTIYCGDNCSVLETLPAACVDLVVTSPPYDDLRTYNGYTWDFERLAGELFRVVKPGGVVVWIVNDKTEDGDESGTSFRQALYFKSIGFRLHDTMIYEVAGTGAKGSTLAYWQTWEFMFVFAKGTPNAIHLISDSKNLQAGKTNGNGRKAAQIGSREERGIRRVPMFSTRTNIWRYQAGNNGIDGKTDHPAPFPEKMARDHIQSWSNAGDTVLDPFLGSGTTLKMARAMGRKGIGIEISEEYCGIAKRRLAQNVLQFPE